MLYDAAIAILSKPGRENMSKIALVKRQETAFLSAAPVVELKKTFTTPFHNAVATARTCYSNKGIIEDEQITPQNYALAQSIYQAGHHTVLGHAHFQFAL